MSKATAAAPEPTEYASYYGGYVSLVPAGDIVETLASQLATVRELLASIDESKGAYRYAPGKWSIKELMGHIIDAERVFSFRALAFARGDEQPIPGMDQDPYVANGKFDDVPLRDLAEQFDHLRAANVLLFKGLPDEAWTRIGTASGNPISVRALAHILAGHVAHHISVLREKYLA
ncbi:MAG TPA: DinB family protein [Blastocatellia bacterium]|nr:DinB family protein [Blastocatellia bacterium]